MTKFSYNRAAYDNYKPRATRLLKCLVIGVAAILLLSHIRYGEIKIGVPTMQELWEGRLEEGDLTGLFLQLWWLTLLVAGAVAEKKCRVILKQIEMCELDLYKKYILVTYPSRQYGDKLAVKCFLRLSYDEIQKIDWEERFEKGQRTNFTIYHKNGCIELLIEHPEWAATAIDESIKMSKGLKNVPAEESVLQEDLDAIGENPENESDHRGEFESGISESAISEEKQFESQPCKTLVCPKCWEDLSVPIRSESFVCPHCGNKMEFPSL